MSRGTAAGILCAAALAAGCGKKGPPLPPLSRIPAAVEQIAVERVGDEVYVSATVPAANTDGSIPVSAARIDIYARTAAAPPPPARFLDGAALVASLPVAAVPRPGEPRVGGAAPEGAAPGTNVRVRERFTPAWLQPDPVQGAAREASVQPSRPAAPGGLRRFYMALARNDRNVPGPPGAVAELTLTELPDPPAVVAVELQPDGLSIRWEPVGGLPGFLTDRQMPVERSPIDGTANGPGAASSGLAAMPEGPTRFLVYRVVDPDKPEPVAAPPHAAGRPEPIGSGPIEGFALHDQVPLDERERCYEVRSVRGQPPAAVIGRPSPRACRAPFDIFPPPAPAGVAAVAGDGMVTVMWEPVADPDLWGYVVLRGDAGSDTLLPLTDGPVTDTQYIDRTAVAGMRYAYAVVAVDRRVPLPNRSEPSAVVEELAR